MSREWKPGDVVVGTVNGRDGVRLVAGWSRFDPQLRWCEMSPRWGDGLDDECWYMPNQVSNLRPLAAIDPEDSRSLAVEIAQRVGFALNVMPGRDISAGIEAVQAALREIASATPTVSEPPGIGAVVEDQDGNLYVRFRPDGGVAKWAIVTPDADRAISYLWSQIPAVRVLSEGVVQA